MDLEQAVERAIEMLLSNAQDDDDIIVKKLVESGIDEVFANRLVNFITTAFCMVMYEDSEINFQYSYFFFDEKRNVSEPQLLIDEPVFSSAYNSAKEMLSKNGSNELYLLIASRDAGYSVIQQFLESGSDLKNVELAPMGIYNPRYFYATKRWWEIWK